MVLEKPIDLDVEEDIIELKSKKQHDELFDLVTTFLPGYFRKQTADLGAYFGIYKNEKLIATSGERMKMNQYTEVSAIVTHPEYTRKGFSKQLTTHTSKRIFDENKLPYLHVAETNTSAIQLYEKLGFRTRRKISVWKLVTTK